MNWSKIFTAAAAFVAVVILPIPVSAQTVTMHLTSVNPVAATSGHAGTANGSWTTGLLRFTVDSVVPTPFIPFSPTLDLFCVELAENVTYTTPNAFQILSAPFASSNGPGSPGFGANIPVGGIGATRARNLEILYANVFGSSYNPLALTSAQRAGFQVAVWELSHDDDLSLTATTNPHFWANSISGAPLVTADLGISALARAQQYVGGVAAVTGNANAARMSLSVLHSDTIQDFLLPNATFSIIPEPSTYAAIFTALTAVGAILIRRRRSQAAA